MWLAFGACHAPHQAPFDLIRKYDAMFADGWDAERERRLARQIELGIVPKGTRLPPRNDAVRPWAEVPEGERRLFTRLQAAYAAMLDHADQHIARLMAFLETAGQLDDTLVVVMSDNGASQEGGPFGMVNAMGPYNLRREPLEEKIARIDDIGGPDTHSNFPLGWAMAANTPLRRYKQNTHGGGIRDPLVMAWDKGIAARGELRHQFCHASDLVPTLLEIVGVKPPKTINGVEADADRGHELRQEPRRRPRRRSKAKPQYFEMFGHRGLVQDGWKAVSLPSAGQRLRPRQVGAVPSRPRLQRDRRSRRARARAAEGDDRGMVAPGRGAQGAAARRPLRAALRRQCQALPRAAQELRLPCRHGPCADRRGARRAQPQLYDRGRCARRRADDRGRADRPWRHDLAAMRSTSRTAGSPTT